MYSNILQLYKIDKQYSYIVKLKNNIMIFIFWKIYESAFKNFHDLQAANLKCKRLHSPPFFHHALKRKIWAILDVLPSRRPTTHFSIHKSENAYIGSTSTFHNRTQSIHNHPQPYSPKGLGHFAHQRLLTPYHKYLEGQYSHSITHKRSQINVCSHLHNIAIYLHCEQPHILSLTLFTNSQSHTTLWTISHTLWTISQSKRSSCSLFHKVSKAFLRL